MSEMPVTNTATLNHNRIDLLQVLRLSKFPSLKLRVDVPQKSGQHAAGAHFDEPRDTLRRECVNRFAPSNRVGNLLIKAFTRLRSSVYQARLPVVYKWHGQIATFDSVQIHGEPLLSGRHQ